MAILNIKKICMIACKKIAMKSELGSLQWHVMGECPGAMRQQAITSEKKKNNPLISPEPNVHCCIKVMASFFEM